MKHTTIIDITKELGISKSTVSRALSGDTHNVKPEKKNCARAANVQNNTGSSLGEKKQSTTMLMPINTLNTLAAQPLLPVHLNTRPVIGAPKSNHGRQRPQRDLVRSLRLPITGSLTASHIRETSIRVATAAILTPNTSVQKIIRNETTNDQLKLQPTSPNPQANLLKKETFPLEEVVFIVSIINSDKCVILFIGVKNRTSAGHKSLVLTMQRYYEILC